MILAMLKKQLMFSCDKLFSWCVCMEHQYVIFESTYLIK